MGPDHAPTIERQAGLVIVVGLLTGVLTQLLQSLLPDGWSQAANAITPWLFVAFLLGAAMSDEPRAAAAGAAGLALALVGYYAMTEIRYGIGVGTSSLVFWGLGALVGGPVFGVAGRWWRVGSPRRRAAALGLLVAVAVAEGLYHVVVLAEPAVGAGFMVVGGLVPLVLGRSRDDRLAAYLAAVPALLLGALGFAMAIWLNGVTAAL